MLNKNMRKREIEEVLEGKGEFVKIDYLTRYLKTIPPFEMRKFAYAKLAEIYEEKRMFFDAAKTYKNIALSSLTFRDKIKYHLKEAESFIKAGEFVETEKALKSALSEANADQRIEIHKDIKKAYMEHAENLEKEFKTNNASKIYEKILTLDLSEDEEKDVRKKLLELYEKLGKIKELKFLKNIDG